MAGDFYMEDIFVTEEKCEERRKEYCQKCVGNCYINECKKKVIKGGMCSSGL